MPGELVQNRYGKSGIRLVKVRRPSGRAAQPHEIIDVTIDVQLEGAFDAVYTDGDNRRCLPTDTMKNTVYALASGASGVRVEPESDDELALGEALDALLRQLGLEIVADGEGAGRAGRVVVRGEVGLVEPVARAVADSPLVKTALHGADPKRRHSQWRSRDRGRARRDRRRRQ